MPSLRMKAKSTTGCLTGKNGLHICRKSCVISKNPPSPARISPNVEEVGTCIQNSFHASFYDEVYDLEVAGAETNHDEFFDVEHFLQKQQFNESDSSAADNLDTEPPPCTSNVDTIFSSILESLDFLNGEGIDHLYVPKLDSKENGDSSSRNQCESQACNDSDLYVSEIIFPGPHALVNSLYVDKTDAMSWLDYKCKESSLLSDVAEEYRILPFLEDTFDAGQEHDSRTSGEAILDAENSNLCNIIHQVRPCDLKTCHDPDYECFDPQMYIRNITGQPDVSLCYPSDTKDTQRITLVLDLDETLVHSTLDYCEDADFTFPIFFSMKEHTVYVKKRPHLNVFLKRVAELFDIMIFTASQSIYAKQLLDILDPEGKLLSKRAYRESCIILEGNYVKDLTVLGVDLAKVAIIDNSPQVFKLQINNGIPIRSWFDDLTDCALISLLPFLETLVDTDDVRPIIARKFGFSKKFYVLPDNITTLGLFVKPCSFSSGQCLVLYTLECLAHASRLRNCFRDVFHENLAATHMLKYTRILYVFSAVDPGALKTSIVREFPTCISQMAYYGLQFFGLLQSSETGAGSIVDGALASPEISGVCFFGGNECCLKSSGLSHIVKLAEDLWATSCDLFQELQPAS